MGGFKTVTASEGYEFKITASNGRKWVVGEYAEGSDGYISFAQYPEWAVLNPTIELVEVTNATSGPEPEQDSPSVLFEMPWDEMLAVGRGGDRLQVDRNGQYWILRRCPVSDAVIASGLGRRK